MYVCVCVCNHRHEQKIIPYQHSTAALVLVLQLLGMQLVLQSVHCLLQELTLPVVLSQHFLLDAGRVQVLLAVDAVQLLHGFLQGPWGLDVFNGPLQVPLEPPEHVMRELLI